MKKRPTIKSVMDAATAFANSLVLASKHAWTDSNACAKAHSKKEKLRVMVRDLSSPKRRRLLKRVRRGVYRVGKGK